MKKALYDHLKGEETMRFGGGGCPYVLFEMLSDRWGLSRMGLLLSWWKQRKEPSLAVRPRRTPF